MFPDSSERNVCPTVDSTLGGPPVTTRSRRKRSPALPQLIINWRITERLLIPGVCFTRIPARRPNTWASAKTMRPLRILASADDKTPWPKISSIDITSSLQMVTAPTLISNKLICTPRTLEIESNLASFSTEVEPYRRVWLHEHRPPGKSYQNRQPNVDGMQ